MRRVVISCYKYRDTWEPFLALYQKFCGGPIVVLTDKTDYREWPAGVSVAIESGTWCEMLAKFAERSTDPLLLFQDDFFLTDYVNQSMLHYAEDELRRNQAGCVRLYPCPGSDDDYGDPCFGTVRRDAAYRISCQVAVWDARYVAKVATHAKTSPASFELSGTPFSRTLPEPVLAFKREVQPWPMEYLCSAISRGQWNPDAKTLCDRHGIKADFSMRPMMVTA